MRTSRSLLVPLFLGTLFFGACTGQDASDADDGDADGSGAGTAANDAPAGAADHPDEDAESVKGAPAFKCMTSKDASLAKSKWVSWDDSGKLTYAKLPTGERILDFSSAGYMGGGVALPDVPVKAKVHPSGGDDTAAIRDAIQHVSKLPVVGGARGAVLLEPGTFHVSQTLEIEASGVVLRGSGSGAGGTVLRLTGKPRAAISIQGAGSYKTGKATTLSDKYVPSGARSFHVDDTAGLEPGTPVLVSRPVTEKWVHFMGMDDLVRDGKHQTWIKAGAEISADRVITAVSGDKITLDAPITDSYDAKYTGDGVTVAPYSFPGRIAQVGLESMRIVAPKQIAPLSEDVFSILDMDAVIDGWVKDVRGDEFINGFSLGRKSKRITIVGSKSIRTLPIDGSSGYPFSFMIDGQQTLVLRSAAQGDKVFSFATEAQTPGPNVVLDFSGKGDWTSVQPHQRWATGLLLDHIHTPGGSIDLLNRGILGSGHGWTIGFGVVWNSVAQSLTIQRPPGAQNWAIGSSGDLEEASQPGGGKAPMPSGIIDAHGKLVAPESLYLAQLCQRLGPKALQAIGY
jgi:hypothetical protein